MAKGKVSKNSKTNREGKTASHRNFNGQMVKPVKYFGKNAGHGNYMAAQNVDNGELVFKDGRPINWDMVSSATANASSGEASGDAAAGA